MPLWVLGLGFPSVQPSGIFSDAQDSGRMGGGNNPGFKTQEAGSSPCLAAVLLGTLGTHITASSWASAFPSVK